MLSPPSRFTAAFSALEWGGREGEEEEDKEEAADFPGFTLASILSET